MLDFSYLWSSALLVEIAIGLSLAEWVALGVYRRLTGKGLRRQEYAWNLASGLCLMLALRSALLGHGWVWGAVFMSASGMAHIAFLCERWWLKRQAAQSLL